MFSEFDYDHVDLSKTSYLSELVQQSPIHIPRSSSLSVSDSDGCVVN